MRRARLGLLLALAGCDPTAGLADSADAAMPSVKRYFDGRGSRLREGPWQSVVVDLDPETLYHVGARRLDDEEPTFHLFGADDREGCQVSPNSGTWLTGKPPQAPFRLLPFHESTDESGRGRMRFTTLDCAVQDLVIEDAGRPYSRAYDGGYLVPTKRGYTFADPWRGEQRVIAEDLRQVVRWDSEAILLLADDRLRTFSPQFEPGAEWGNSPVAVVRLNDDFLVEDADGLHHVEVDRDTLAITSEPVLPGACRLQKSGSGAFATAGSWLAVHMPCDAPRPTLILVDYESLEVRDSFALPFEIDARHARPLLREVGPDEAQQLVVFFLTDVDDDDRGTLWAWHEDLEQPIRLGERAEVDACYLTTLDSEWDGGAKINNDQLGAYAVLDWVRFRWDGTTRVPAQRVLNAPSGDLLINFDGVAGDLPKLDSRDELEVLARGIPPSLGELISFSGARLARVDRYDGTAGRLLLGSADTDRRDWSSVGSAVAPTFVRFAWFMPALVFIERWDANARTGNLVAYNYELDARATLAEGVSSFDLTGYPLDGVVYTVPSGDARGIWFSKAK